MNDWGRDAPNVTNGFRGKSRVEWEPQDWLPEKLVARARPSEPGVPSTVSSLLERVAEVDEAVSSSADRVADAVGSIVRTARLPSRRDHS
jgi:hypothetical protein